MDACARKRSADHSPPCVPAGAALLISSRALLDAADLIEHAIATAPIQDYAGWDVLRGLGGMSADEADEAVRHIVRGTLEQLCEQLRDQADHDWDRAVSSIGSTMRTRRRSPKRVQHRPPRRPRAATGTANAVAPRRPLRAA